MHDIIMATGVEILYWFYQKQVYKNVHIYWSSLYAPKTDEIYISCTNVFMYIVVILLLK